MDFGIAIHGQQVWTGQDELAACLRWNRPSDLSLILSSRLESDAKQRCRSIDRHEFRRARGKWTVDDKNLCTLGR